MKILAIDFDSLFRRNWEAEAGQAFPRGLREAALADDLPALLEAVVLVDKALHGVAQGLLVFAEIKIHGDSPARQPSRVWATILRCTSLEPP